MNKYSKEQLMLLAKAKDIVYEIITTREYIQADDLRSGSLNNMDDASCCICNYRTDLVYFLTVEIDAVLGKYSEIKRYFGQYEEGAFEGYLEDFIFYCPDNTICPACLPPFIIMPEDYKKKLIYKRFNEYLRYFTW